MIASPKLAERLSPARVSAIAVLASIPAKLLSERLSDLDLWWHLRTGEYIVSTHHIPRHDFFSYTVPGKAWVVQEWLSEVVLHGIRSAFGLWGIFVWRAVMLLLIYAIIARLFVRRMGSGIGTWVLFAIAAYAGAVNWTERPNLFSFALFATTLLLLDQRGRSLWWFVPMAALWANLHGMVVLGIGLVFVVAVAESLKVALHWEDADPLWARRLAFVTGAAAAAALLNPYGPGLYTHAFELVRIVGTLITEWASPNFHEAGTLIFLVLLLLTVAGLALSPQRADPTDVALALAFTVLALSAVRNLAVSSMVLGLVAARTLPAALAAARPRPAGRADLPAGSSAAFGLLGLIVALGALGLVAADGFPQSDGPADIVNKTYPTAAIDALDRPGVRLFTRDVWAGLVIDRDWPRVHVYLDSRVDMYGQAVATRYSRAINGLAGWEATLDGACTTHVLVRRRDPITQLLELSRNWSIEREDSRSVTFVRYGPAPGCEDHPIG